MVQNRDRRFGILYAVLAVVFFSLSPVLIRWAEPLSAYEITAERLAVAAIVVLALAHWQKQQFLPLRAIFPRFLSFGLVTALHFLFYIASLSFTTIAHALAMVYTAPIFVTAASAWWLREPIPLQKWLGVVVAIVGVAILVGFEPQLNSRMIIGDLLALGSAVMFGFYSVVGRSQRSQYPLLTYAGTVYALAALWTLPAAVLTFTPTNYGLQQVVSVIALGILPLGLGHTLYNAALRRVHATYVNVIATQEVTGGVILGVLFLQEVPSLNTLIGAVVTLIGIALVV